MSEPFLAEIKMFGFNFAPRGWALCDGQLLPINQYQSLYSLLGTTYGGDGRSTFGLPELRGRTPVHEGTGFPLGQKGGQQTHLLTQPELPAHDHQLVGTDAAANQALPAGKFMAQTPTAVGPIYTDAAAALDKTFATTAISQAGANQAHANEQPYLVVEFCIATTGLFPSRN